MKNIVSGGFFFAFSVLIYISSFSIKTAVANMRVGPGFIPRLCAIAVGILSLIVLGEGLWGQFKKKAEETPAAEGVERNTRAVALTFVLITAYLALLNSVGFLITTAVYLFFQFWVLAGNRKVRLWLLALIAAVASVLVYYLFVRVFYLMLPAGILG
jgi:putative tricarboxylic transport membrane protein